jgi:hypothetical protein
VAVEDLDDEAARALKEQGVTEDNLKNDVALRFRQAGMTVIEDNDHPWDALADVSITVVPIELQGGGHVTGYAASISVTLLADAIPDHLRGVKGLLHIWSINSVSVVGSSNAKAFRESIKDFADRLANDWLKENPKR